MAALLVLLLFISGIVFFEIQFLQEKNEPSIYQINGSLDVRDIEVFRNGTVILYLENRGPVPVNLTEVFIRDSERRILEVITSIRQDIPVKKEVIIPITVTFSTENLDFNETYGFGCSWSTKTGQGDFRLGADFYFSS